MLLSILHFMKLKAITNSLSSLQVCVFLKYLQNVLTGHPTCVSFRLKIHETLTFLGARISSMHHPTPPTFLIISKFCTRYMEATLVIFAKFVQNRIWCGVILWATSPGMALLVRLFIFVWPEGGLAMHPPSRYRITSALVKPFGRVLHFIRAIYRSF